MNSFDKDNLSFRRNLLLVDLITKICNLGDLTTNAENFGVLMSNNNSKAKIIDFKIPNNYYDKDYNIYDKFLGNHRSLSLINKSCFQPLYLSLNKDISMKTQITFNILKDELKDFVKKVDEAIFLTLSFIDIVNK